jgi:hypothetical protein
MSRMAVMLEQATRRLLGLLDNHEDYVPIELIEEDEDFAESREVVTAAARALATESDIVTGEETHLHEHWFPYSFLMRSK